MGKQQSTALARTETLDMATAGTDADTEVQVIDVGAIAALNQSEIEQQVATAHKYPRSISRFRAELVAMATIDQATADSCIYALPRAGRTIEGPSVRFAEMVASAWGNLRWGAGVIEANDRYVVARGFCHDLQTNSAIAIEVRRRVVGSRNDDMVQLACAAATSIARRNALFATVPRALTQEAYDAADHCATTGKGSFEEHRERTLAAFIEKGAKREQVYAAIGVTGIDDITGQHIRHLRRLFAALKDGAAMSEVLRPVGELQAEQRGRAASTASDITTTVKPQKGSTPKRERQPGEDDEDPTDKNAP
jgi:hypothetical protein